MATIVIEMAKRSFPEVDELVGRDSVATAANLVVAFAWFAHYLLSQKYSKQTCNEIADHMLGEVADDLKLLLNWSDENIQRMIRSRLAGYKNAWDASESSERLANAVNYFFGCCTDMRIELPYESVIPDPADLESMEDLVNPEWLAALKEIQMKHNTVTYPLNFSQTMEMACLFGGIMQGIASVL